MATSVPKEKTALDDCFMDEMYQHSLLEHKEQLLENKYLQSQILKIRDLMGQAGDDVK